MFGGGVIITVLVAVLSVFRSSQAFDMEGWANSNPDTSDIKMLDSKHVKDRNNDGVASTGKMPALEESNDDAHDMEAALKALEEQTLESNGDPTEHQGDDHLNENKETAESGSLKESEKLEQPKIEVPFDDKDHTKLVSKNEYDSENIIKNSSDNEKSGTPPAAMSEAYDLIPTTPSDEPNDTSGNNDAIIDDTTSLNKNMRQDAIDKIDKTIVKLDQRLRVYLESVAIGAHDLDYYQRFLDHSYETFCREINGDLSQLGGDNAVKDPNDPTMNVQISAKMSSAIRQSFDTKVEVLELAAAEVATQKSKEIGARIIHDALINGLIAVKSAISSPALTVRNEDSQMHNLNGIVAGIAKSLVGDIISWTLKEDVLKKKLFDEILKRNELLKKHADDSGHINKFTLSIRGFAADFHVAQKERINSIQKENGFKEYLESMREDIYTIQRLIDTYFATVHKGHAKALLQEATNDLSKSSDAESEQRLGMAEAKVRVENDATEEKIKESLQCPANYRPLNHNKPIADSNPCVRLDKWTPSR
uniref:BOV57 n=1 Tax=Babesia motasi TaxID=237580 RepID=A0A6M8PDV4_9APIC|nr:BOV57 [Babesia motasi]QKG30645.1 BOV57 [Babesia motasi]